KAVKSAVGSSLPGIVVGVVVALAGAQERPFWMRPGAKLGQLEGLWNARIPCLARDAVYRISVRGGELTGSVQFSGEPRTGYPDAANQRTIEWNASGKGTVRFLDHESSTTLTPTEDPFVLHAVLRMPHQPAEPVRLCPFDAT